MRYILNEEGYLYDVSFGAEIECSLGTCTEYKGDIPEDYETIEEWFSGESERLNAWKIVDGNLVFDASRDYKLKIIYEQEANENTHVTRKEMGMASTEEVNPYAELYPSLETASTDIIGVTEDYGKVGNLPTEEIKLRVDEDQDIDFVEIEFIGSNFLPNTALSSKNNGIEYIPNVDKTIKVSGTATAKSTLNLAGTDTSIKKILTFKGKSNYGYHLFGLEEGVNLEFYYYDGTDRTLVGTYNNGIIQFDKDIHVTQVVLTVDEGTTIDATIKPMLAHQIINYPVLPMTKYKANLLNPVGASDSYNGLTFTNEGNGVFSISGTATKTSGFGLTSLSLYPIELKKGKYYTQKVFMLEGNLNFSITTAIKKEDGTTQYNFFVNNHTRQMEFDTNITVYNAYIPEGTIVNARFKVMLQEGQSIDEYKEYNNRNGWYYVDGVSTQATRGGKNLVDVLGNKPTGTTSTINGVTFTVLEDGRIKVNGTATAKAVFYIIENANTSITDGVKTISGGSTNVAFQLSINRNGTYVYPTVRGTTSYSTYTNSFIKNSCLVVSEGQTVNNEIVYLQFEDGSTATEYEPYGVSPSPEYPSEMVNVYSAGTYNVALNGTLFEFTIPEDLRSLPSGVADRLWIDLEDSKAIEFEKKIGNVVLNGSESSWLENSVTKGLFQITLENITTDMTKVNAMSNYFKGSSATDIVNSWYTNNSVSTYTSNRLFFRSDEYANNLDGFKTLLSTNNVEVYYELETPLYPHEIICSYYLSEYEEYKNNKALVDLKGNKFTIYDIVHIRDNQIIFVKNGVKGTDIEEIYLGDISMPRTYTPMTIAYCHQQVDIQFKYRDVRNINITKISLKGLLSITDIETEYNYTLEDIEKVIAYVNGEASLTDEELEYYDINADGVVDKVDSAEMLRMYHGYISNIVNGTLEINSTKANRTIVLRDSEGKIRTSLGLNGATTPNLSCEKLTVNNIDLIDALFFKGGETYTINRIHVGGFITSSNEQVSFTIPLPKRLDKITSINILSGKMIVRVPTGGYINNGTYDNPIKYGDSGYTWSVPFFNENTVTINVNKSSDYTNVTNNSPLGIQIEDLQLQFNITGEGEEETEPSIENIVEVNKTSTINGTTSSNVWNFKSVVTEKSIDRTNKTSIVTVTNYLGRPSTSGSSYFMGTLTNKYKCGDQTYSETVYKNSGTIGAGSWYKLGSHTFTIEHTEEPMTINVGGSMSTSAFNPSSASASGTITLTEINEEVE